MKHMAAMNVVAEVGVDEYISTPLSNAMMIPEYRDGIEFQYAEVFSLYVLSF